MVFILLQIVTEVIEKLVNDTLYILVPFYVHEANSSATVIIGTTWNTCCDFVYGGLLTRGGFI